VFAERSGASAPRANSRSDLESIGHANPADRERDAPERLNRCRRINAQRATSKLVDNRPAPKGLWGEIPRIT